MMRIVVVSVLKWNTFLSADTTAEMTVIDINDNAFPEVSIAGKKSNKTGITIKITVE